ncbi:MAG: alpha/beta hydrolase [Phenylobacterium sp.]|nr:MAG: alpha/beta hydrolase [Phenylobacterium sp.]
MIALALTAALFAQAAAAADPQSPPARAATTLSSQGQAAVLATARGPGPPQDLAGRRAFLDQAQRDGGARQQKTYPVRIEASTMAGVPVRLITPAGPPRQTRLVLLNLHGGGFNADSGSLTENIPIAALTGVPVVAVLYRLAPEHQADAALADAVAVYRELLKTHRPSEIGLYGTSAGAILGPELIERLKTLGLPEPAVLGMFAGDADLTRTGGSEIAQKSDVAAQIQLYLGRIPAGSPAASPLLGDLKGFPPTLCMTSTDDLFLSATANFCRGLDEAGVESKLVVFDGLPHAFWAYIDAPESDQAFRAMARFLKGHLGKPAR